MKSKIIILIMTALLSNSPDVFAVCKGSIHNPLTEVCWKCIFPIQIGGLKISKNPSGLPDDGKITSPVCVCPTPLGIPRPGIPISFWEPARFTETVKDAYCFPSLGFGLTNPSGGFLNGSTICGGGVQEGTSTFQQAHFFIYPIWTMMELLIDFICVEHSGFDLAYMTEVDPTWNDDALAMIMYPETLLFANLPAQLSCMADSAGSNAGRPVTALFWCMGSWGSTYPMSGNINEDDITEASIGLAARMIYKMARIGAICDTGVTLCSCVPTLIWIKKHYRFNIAKPVIGSQCIPIGRSASVWGSMKNPALPVSGNASDNFMHILFRKRTCCAF